MTATVETLIAQLNLKQHPEGGWYNETYRSDEITDNLPGRFTGARNFSTGIYFLLPGNAFSAFHRIKSDEMWHFYDGDMLEVFVIDDNGSLQVIRLGKDLSKGQVYQAVVKQGYWFASCCSVPDGFSLVGCTVSPGFDFKDFEMADGDDLAEQYPQHSDLVAKFTRKA